MDDRLIWAGAAAWMTGAIVTWIRLGRISVDSVEIRFIIAFFCWPLFWLGR